MSLVLLSTFCKISKQQFSSTQPRTPGPWTLEISSTIWTQVFEIFGNWKLSCPSSQIGTLSGLTHCDLKRDKKRKIEVLIVAVSHQLIVLTEKCSGQDLVTGLHLAELTLTCWEVSGYLHLYDLPVPNWECEIIRGLTHSNWRTVCCWSCD